MILLLFFILLLIFLNNLSRWGVIFLENRFSVPQTLPQNVEGIILLGGSFNNSISTQRKQVAYNHFAGRIPAFVALAHQYPNAKLVFTGAGVHLGGAQTESAIARKLFVDLGLDDKRLIYENRSKNTYENALFTWKKLQPKNEKTWILVTSALHMPRAVGHFTKMGWKIIPYPCDYHTSGKYGWSFWPPLSVGLLHLSLFTHEIMGIAYGFMKGYVKE